MFCYKCGKEIDDEAIVCVHCGAKTKNLKKDEKKPVTVVNQNTNTGGTPIIYSGLLDFIMILLTSGLWIIWMICRPKYR